VGFQEHAADRRGFFLADPLLLVYHPLNIYRSGVVKQTDADR